MAIIDHSRSPTFFPHILYLYIDDHCQGCTTLAGWSEYTGQGMSKTGAPHSSCSRLAARPTRETSGIRCLGP